MAFRPSFSGSLLATLTVTALTIGGSILLNAGASLTIEDLNDQEVVFSDNGTLSGDSGFTFNSSTGAVSSTRYIADSGTAGSPGFTFNGDEDTGIYSDTANRVDITIGGNKAVVFVDEAIPGSFTRATFGFGSLAGQLTPHSDNTGRIGTAGLVWNGLFVNDADITNTLTATDGNFSDTVTSTHMDINTGSSATSTQKVGDSDTPGCLIVGDSDGAGVTYITTLNGSVNGSTSDCR